MCLPRGLDSVKNSLIKGLGSNYDLSEFAPKDIIPPAPSSFYFLNNCLLFHDYFSFFFILLKSLSFLSNEMIRANCNIY